MRRKKNNNNNHTKRKEYNTNKILFKDGFVSQMSPLGLALRVGDAYVSKAKIFLPDGKKVSWKYNGKYYSSNMLVLTQAGVYMAFDSNATYYNSNISNDDNTESSNYGAFMYFTLED